MAETDLYAPIKRFLTGQGYEVKAEVGACDVVAVRGGEPPVIVEMKTAVSLKLILQGIDRQAITDAVYLAVKAPKRRELADIVKLCRRLGLGLLTVSGQHVEPLADPAPYQPRKNAKRKAMLLREFALRVGDPNCGGATRRPVMTAYRQDALRCARVLGERGAVKVADIRAVAGVTRAGAILLDDVYGWFARAGRGIYTLSPKGAGALGEYGEVVAGL